MAKIRKSISIRAPVDKVFEYAGNPDNLLEFWPSMADVENIKPVANGGAEYDWTYKMAGMKFKGHAKPTSFERNKRFSVKNETGIPSSFIWSFDGENGGTRLSLDVEYEIPHTLLGKLAEPFLVKLNEREADAVLENIKARCEEATLAAGKPEARPSVH